MKKLNLPERSPALGRDEAVSVGRGSPERGAGPGVPPDQVLVLRSRGQGVAGGQVRHVTAEDRQILTLDRRHHGGPGLIRRQGVSRGTGGCQGVAGDQVRQTNINVRQLGRG